jgi:hypothetical protein
MVAVKIEMVILRIESTPSSEHPPAQSPRQLFGEVPERGKCLLACMAPPRSYRDRRPGVSHATNVSLGAAQNLDIMSGIRRHLRPLAPSTARSKRFFTVFSVSVSGRAHGSKFLFTCAQMNGMQKSGPLSPQESAAPIFPVPIIPKGRGRHSYIEL